MPLRSSAKFRFSSIWMKILTIYILIPYFPSPNLGTFLLRFSAYFIGWSFQEAANLFDARDKLLFHISRNVEITPSKSRGKSIPGLGWVKMWQSSPTQSETNNFGNSALDSTQHNGSRILGREKKRCVCGWKLPTNRIYDCLPLFLLRAQAIARPPARALAARIAGELLDCTYATAQRNMKCTPQLPLKFSNEKSCICCSG